MTKQICINCRYWKKDWGVYTVMGWTGSCRDDGYCHLEPKPIFKKGDNLCSHFEVREDDNEPT